MDADSRKAIASRFAPGASNHTSNLRRRDFLDDLGDLIDDAVDVISDGAETIADGVSDVVDTVVDGAGTRTP